MNRIHTVLLFLFSLIPLHSAGQVIEEHKVFNKLTISEQIFWPIHTIFQDQKGMMWFSGKNYLLSYDGTRMDTLSIRNVKGEVSITGILESINADLAVSTTKGLYIIDPGSNGTVTYESVLDGCIKGLLYYSFSNGLIKKLSREDGLPSDI